MKAHRPLLYLLVLFSLMTCIGTHAYANYAVGGEITYMHLTGNQYLIRLTFYRDCSGIPAPATVTVTISSSSCVVSDTLVLNPLPGTGQELQLPCTTGVTSCQGGSDPGMQKWVYENTYGFTAQCPDWLIHASFSARSSAITTIQNPNNSDIYLEARLNNSLTDNSSPQFGADPVVFICMNQYMNINNNMNDPDGDSLVYSLIAARSDANTNVTYMAPLSGQQPLNSNPAVAIDSVTGDVMIKPTIQETGVMVYLINDYRNGVLMGSVMRDIMLFTLPCTNTPPFSNGINQSGMYALTVAPGPFCFNIFSSDNDVDDSLIMTFNTTIPGASFNSYGNYHPIGVFCWSPDSADVRPQPYTFFVTIRDHFCPDNGAQIYSYTITVTLDSNLVTPLQAYGFYTGQVYYDLNMNGVKDGGEINLANQKIDITTDNYSVFTDPRGEYIFFSMLGGSHIIAADPPPGWIITSDSLTYSVADSSIYHAGFDFGIAPDTVVNAIGLNICSSSPSCNSQENYWVTYENTGSTLADGRIIFIIDSATTYATGNPAPDVISGDTLIYNFSNLWPLQSRDILMNLLLPGAGASIHFDAYAEMDSAGIYSPMDTAMLQQIVLCSYDPNDKSVIPEGLYTAHRTLYPGSLLYTIRFQNTGNDTAFTVYIQDVLSPFLDVNTLHVTGSSHPVSTTIHPGRLVEFRFEDIDLPDSSVNALASNGFVQFEISPKDNLLLPVAVENTANIFFDSNAPVTTNTVFNTYVSDLFVGVTEIIPPESGSIVVPNPFHDYAEIRLGKSFATATSKFKVMNSLGEIVYSSVVDGPSIQISRRDLSDGIYFYEVISGNGNHSIGRFILN